MKKFLALFLSLIMVSACLPVLADEAPTVIRFGTHWVNELDPHMIDETTGAYTIGDEEDRLIRIAAEDKVRELYNVEIDYIQYAQDTRSELVLSVLAGNPVCDLALMWNGSENTVLAQNILQPLDDYAGIFDGDYILVEESPVASDGDIIVALIDNSVTVKRFFKEKDHIRLQPENDFMDPIIVPADTPFSIVGTVIGLYRKF